MTWKRCNVPVCGGAVCPALVGNLETLDKKTRYQYGESVILSCKSGYKLSGQRYLTCLQSGQWNDTIPRCEDLNKCSSSPCQNGGTCADGVNGHTCTCRDSNFGFNCQYDISKCHNVTCFNGGICKEELNDIHVCICIRGYSGTLCEQEPTFKVAPQIILKDKMTVDEGSSNSRIPCFAEGIPLPIIKWQSMTKTTLPSNARQVIDFLVFENVTTADSGMYICTARNEVGTDVKVIRLIVKAKPGILHTGPVIHTLSTVKVDYYTDAVLVCNVTGFPTPTVTWKYGNKLLLTSGNIMVVHNVTNTTTGQYTCIATNDVGTSQVNIFLEVTYDTPKIVIPPRTAFVMIGQSHNFTCVATGHPKPSLTWSYKTFAQESALLPSHQLHQGGQVLTLFALKTLESGTLTCAAENAFGVDRASVTVIFKSRMY
ncbi:hemicentin-1-like [Mytilus trossulus]|uniref:hemicentin-1-like n=1 Tax=Mytilus trossulus TaxID=6551 RepID=UPI003006432F